jgi:hypothetical protein
MNEADSTVADYWELRIPAQRRHVDGERASGVENRRSRWNGYRAAVDR